MSPRAWRARPRFLPRVATLVPPAAARDGLAESALVTAFTAPHSFTGEDTVEISTHGSPVIVDAVLRACLDAGARLARPGEFTLRAYLNGRLDLLQAEAVADLVAATTAAQVRVASAHLEGTLSQAIAAMATRSRSCGRCSRRRSTFPTRAFISSSRRSWSADRVPAATCERLLGSAAAGQRLHDGALVVIAGAPNAGKSSLFNALSDAIAPS